MKQMKKYAWAFIVILIALIVALILYFKEDNIITHPLIDALDKPIAGKEITVANTDVLDSVFYTAQINAVPRLYLTNFPSDFAQKGNPTLFVKVMTPLILRANERILQERAILKILDYKLQKEMPWTKKETAFFNRMVEKYDCVLFKTPKTQMKELLIKVDEIPVSLAVIQAGIQTRFGREKLNAPFGEKMWYDRTKYDDKIFDTLINATDSYTVLLNATIPYYQWRQARQKTRPLNYASPGNVFSGLMSTYNPEDKDYIHKIMAFYHTMHFTDLDKARFVNY